MLGLLDLLLGLLELLVEIITRPRRFLQWLVSQAVQIGFAIIAAPVGCAVLGVTMFVGIGLFLLLETLFGGPGIFFPLVPVAFVGGLVLAFVALVRLYRAMPARVRRVIEIDDDPGPKAPPVEQPSMALTGAELAALDAKLAPPAERTDQDR